MVIGNEFYDGTMVQIDNDYDKDSPDVKHFFQNSKLWGGVRDENAKRWIYTVFHINWRGNLYAVLEYLGLIIIGGSMVMLCEPMKKLHVGAIFVY